ncbi:MAG: hypothetical protein Rubg2KO_27020 [Rubricoccaceae bacterium]
MFHTLTRSALILLALTFAACSYGEGDGNDLILDGTYRGSGLAIVGNAADPGTTNVTVAATFDQTTVGALEAGMEVTITVFGGPPETYAGTLTGTLGSDGALSLDGQLPGGVSNGNGTNVILVDLDGEASTTRIEATMFGSFQVPNLVLTR